MSKGLIRSKAEKILDSAGIKINGEKDWDIQIHDDSIFRDYLISGTLGLGDGYTKGKWDVKKLDVFFEKLLRKGVKRKLSLSAILFAIRNALINTQVGHRAFEVGHKHYDIGNEMYEYMLGKSMGYSCGMYLKKTDTLYDAQMNKFDSICQKLDLKPGMKVLEIGSGWGTLAKHAAEKYGVKVTSLSVSKEQLKFARKICKGLPIKFLLKDYQKLESKFDGKFDRVISIEMIEAVGKKNFRKYFETVNRVLKEDGLFGLQSIVGTGRAELFTSIRIFPNGLVPSRKQIEKNINGLLEIKSWHAFGKDYDKTLMTWDKNFRQNWSKIKQLKDEAGNKLYDEEFYRMWRYYLLMCAASFRVGHNDDAQIVLKKV